MTPEEKAKAYDEAIKRARKINSGEGIEAPPDWTICEVIFPELKENEDDRIRKAIIDIVKSQKEQQCHIDSAMYDEMLAWLEKQDEQKPKDRYTFKSIPRLLEMIKPTDRAKAYCQKLIDSLLQEGYSTDAKIVSDCLKQMNGEKIAMATMDEKQGEKDKKEITNFEVIPGLYKCVHRMFDGTPDGKLLFEVGNVYKCLSKHDRAEFEVSYGHSVYLEDPAVCKHFIPFENQGEQKPDNKVEPKFRPGDWITNDICIIKITSVDDRYYWHDNDCVGGDIESLDKEYHLWTIKDAKNGDILACENGCVFIFKALNDHTNTFSSYCFVASNKWFCNTGSECHTLDGASVKFYNGEIHPIYPATKEQRSLLFQKMKDAGYEWDVDKKELKTIEQKPQSIVSEVKEVDKSSRSEEDTVTVKLQRIIDFLWHNRKGDTDTIFQQEQDIAWLKSLKQRLGGEK